MTDQKHIWIRIPSFWFGSGYHHFDSDPAPIILIRIRIPSFWFGSGSHHFGLAPDQFFKVKVKLKFVHHKVCSSPKCIVLYIVCRAADLHSFLADPDPRHNYWNHFLYFKPLVLFRTERAVSEIYYVKYWRTIQILFGHFLKSFKVYTLLTKHKHTYTTKRA